MYRAFCVIAGLILFAPWWALAQPCQNAAARPLASMRDKSRPLLIFYPQVSGAMPVDPAVQRQQVLFERHEVELKQREVAVMLVPLAQGESSTNSKVWSDLRKEFQIAPRGFTVVLIGKDGGEKFRSHEPVTIEKLETLIDAMPMRQQEVRDGHHPE